MLPEKILVSACIVTCHYLISDCVHPNAVTELIGHVDWESTDGVKETKFNIKWPTTVSIIAGCKCTSFCPRLYCCNLYIKISVACV